MLLGPVSHHCSIPLSPAVQDQEGEAHNTSEDILKDRVRAPPSNVGHEGHSSAVIRLVDSQRASGPSIHSDLAFTLSPGYQVLPVPWHSPGATVLMMD